MGSCVVCKGAAAPAGLVKANRMATPLAFWKTTRGGYAGAAPPPEVGAAAAGCAGAGAAAAAGVLSPKISARAPCKAKESNSSGFTTRRLQAGQYLLGRQHARGWMQRHTGRQS